MSDDEENKNKKKIDYKGLAILVAAMVAAPGVLLNTYFDWQERQTQNMVQQSSYEELAKIVNGLTDEIENIVEWNFSLLLNMYFL